MFGLLSLLFLFASNVDTVVESGVASKDVKDQPLAGQLIVRRTVGVDVVQLRTAQSQPKAIQTIV